MLVLTLGFGRSYIVTVFSKTLEQLFPSVTVKLTLNEPHDENW